MAKRPQKFTQRDVTRAIKGAEAAGCEVSGIEFADGKFRVLVGSKTFVSSNEWDNVVQHETQEPAART